MATFKDNAGKEWTVELDRNLIVGVRNTFDGLDLLSIDGAAYQRLRADPILLVDTIWLICEQQAKEQGVSSEDFGRSLAGDAISDATAALLAAILEYSPKHVREPLQQMMAKFDTVYDAGIARAMKQVTDPALTDKLLGKIDDNVTKSIDDFLNG